MITEKDLQEAIAECQGQRNPNANTCIKLAAYYTIQRELYGNHESLVEIPMYSRAEPPAEQPEEYVEYNSGSEFSRVIDGMVARDAWAIIDELMDILQDIPTRMLCNNTALSPYARRAAFLARESFRGTPAPTQKEAQEKDQEEHERVNLKEYGWE